MNLSNTKNFYQNTNYSLATIVGVNTAANVRSEPNSTSEIIGTVPKYETIEVIGLPDNYCEIQYGDLRGFVYNNFIDYHALEHIEYGMVIGTINGINVRDGADTDSNIIGTLPNGSIISIVSPIEHENTIHWYKIEWEDGFAFVSSLYIRDLNQGPVLGATSQSVNLRTEPSTNSTVITTIPKYDSINILGIDLTHRYYYVEYYYEELGEYTPGYASVLYVDTHNVRKFTGKVGGETTNRVNVRKGPGMEYEIIETLPLGTPLHIVDISGNWYKIQLEEFIDGILYYSYGYIYRTYAELDPLQAYVGGETTTAANVRSGPGMEYEVINTIPLGDEIELVDFEENWYKINNKTNPDYDYGYIHRNYVDIPPIPIDDADSMSLCTSKSSIFENPADWFKDLPEYKEIQSQFADKEILNSSFEEIYVKHPCGDLDSPEIISKDDAFNIISLNCPDPGNPDCPVCPPDTLICYTIGVDEYIDGSNRYFNVHLTFAWTFKPGIFAGSIHKDIFSVTAHPNLILSDTHRPHSLLLCEYSRYGFPTTSLTHSFRTDPTAYMELPKVSLYDTRNHRGYINLTYINPDYPTPRRVQLDYAERTTTFSGSVTLSIDTDGPTFSITLTPEDKHEFLSNHFANIPRG